MRFLFIATLGRDLEGPTPKRANAMGSSAPTASHFAAGRTNPTDLVWRRQRPLQDFS